MSTPRCRNGCALRPESGRALTLLDIVPADGAALIRAVGRAAPGRITRLELDLLREDGRAFPAQLICRSHGPKGVISVLVLDRGEELTRAAAHAHTEMRLTRVFQSAPFGIATADADGRIVTANAAFMRMFAVEGRGVPATVAALVPDGEEEAGRELAKALERAVSGRTGAAPIEVFFGPQRELARRIYVSPLNAGPRSREGAVLYAIDATEQKALELKFAQSHKMEAVGKLAGGVAHDFNNVLTAIIGFSDLLLQTHRPTDPAYRDIMNIKSSANRAAGLVRQLLAFSRRQTLQTEVLELGEVLTDLAPLLNRSLGEKIELKILPGRDLWYVKADKTQFDAGDHQPGRQRHATPCPTAAASPSARATSPSARASSSPSSGMAAGEYVLIEVEDTGVGMTRGGDGQDLRAVLHHQGRRQGHGPRPLHRLRHRQADRRLHLRRQRGRQGHHLPRLPAAPHRRERGRDRPAAREEEGDARAISPARAACCWSRTRTSCATSPRARWRARATRCWRPAPAWRRSR